jgi:hypothetical protein
MESILGFMERDLDIADFVNSKMCPLVREYVDHKKPVGTGAGGDVYVINVEGKRYAVKKSVNHGFTKGLPMISDGPIEEEMTLNDAIAHHLEHTSRTISKFTVDELSRTSYIERRDSDKVCKTDKDVICKVHIEEEVRSLVSTTFVYPKGSYMCKNTGYIEALVSELCSRLYTSRKCTNFVEVFGMSTCAHVGELGMEVYDYTFMEVLDSTVWKFLKPRRFEDDYEDHITNIIIQVLFAISSMQRIYGIQHNDLHADNVMCLFDEREAEYFSYDIDGTRVYLPNMGYIVKIVDFGLASKYSIPMATEKEYCAPRNDYKDVMTFVTNNCRFKANTSSLGKKIKRELNLHPWEYLTSRRFLDETFYTYPKGKVVESLGVLTEDDYYHGFFTPTQRIPKTPVSQETHDRYVRILIDLSARIKDDLITTRELVDSVKELSYHPSSYTLFYLSYAMPEIELVARLKCILDYHLETHQSEYLAQQTFILDESIQRYKSQL